MQPVYLSINLKIFQGTIRCCCEHVKHNNNNNNTNNNNQETLQQLSQQILVNHAYASIQYTPCLYSSKEFCNVLLECIKLNSKFCENSKMHPNVVDSIATEIDTITNSAIQLPSIDDKKSITPTVSINVTDSENFNVCMCSLYASSDNVLIEQETMIGTICPRCQNIIKQQPTTHRKTLISKRLTLSNDIIVNRVDTHFLSLKTALEYGKRYEPYTPESVESHSPLPEPDILEFNENDENNQIEINSNIIDVVDAFEMNNKRHVRSLSSHSSGVSPRQLKSRLEILRKTSTDASGMVVSSHILETRKNRAKHGFCFDRCCVIL